MQTAALVGLAFLSLGLGVVVLALLLRNRASSESLEAIRALAHSQEDAAKRFSELSGALGQVVRDQHSRHGELTKTLNDRLEAVSKRMGDTLTMQAEKAAQSLSQLQERLAVIDHAQKNIVELSGQVVSLQDIFSNKQARGAFGQAQMETIIRDTLPAGTFAFNAPLSNGTKPDCTITLPRSGAAIVVDAKFPRESFEALNDAGHADARKAAGMRVRAEVRKHIDDIAQKYLIPGETQDPAIMFVPAESIYCVLAAEFFDIIQYAQRKRVVIVSPNMMMLAVTTMRALIRDQKMREQAHLIQKEVRTLLEDVRRLGERTSSLRRHFAQAEADIKDIETSADKISKRGDRIESVDIEAGEAPAAIEPTPRPALAARSL